METSRRFEVLCIFMLSFGQLCMMTGYDSLSFILESVIHSIHEREPEKIGVLAGYYGQAVCYFTYVLTCFISPSIFYATSAKTTLWVSAVCFTAFPIGFLFTNSYYYYFSSAVLGFGFALYYTGNGGYLTSHSTRQTIGSNVSLSWGFGCCCMMIGSIVMGVITFYTADQPRDVAAAISHGVQRNFSDTEIYLLFSFFSGVSMISVFTFMLLPSKDIPNCIESSEKRVSFMDGMALMRKTLVSPKMFRLAPTFLLCGVHTSFWLSVYPTSLMFNSRNAEMIYLPAIYCFAVGLGETLMGFIISTMSKRITDFSLRPAKLIGCTLSIIYYMLALASTPYNSPTMPTSEEPLLFQPSRYFVFFVGLIAGVSDCCFCSVRSTICAIVMPSRRAQAFSVSKIYQSLGTCVIFFISPSLNIYHYTIGIPVLCVVSGVLFFSEAERTKVMERKITMELEAEAKHKIIMELEFAKLQYETRVGKSVQLK